MPIIAATGVAVATQSGVAIRIERHIVKKLRAAIAAGETRPGALKRAISDARVEARLRFGRP